MEFSLDTQAGRYFLCKAEGDTGRGVAPTVGPSGSNRRISEARNPSQSPPHQTISPDCWLFLLIPLLMIMNRKNMLLHSRHLNSVFVRDLMSLLLALRAQ